MEPNITTQDTRSEADEKLEQIETHLNTSRSEWGDKIIKLVQQIRNVNELADSQVQMLSYRHMIVEQLTKFNIRVRKSKTNYEKLFKPRFIGYYNYDYKMSDKHKVDMVHADLYFYRTQIGLLESQVEYYKECINTLDKMSWAIRNRVNFEEI